MDFNELMSTMLGGDSIKNISKVSGASQNEVMNVLASALPNLLSGAESQAKNEKTAESFVGALADHARDDTTDIASFLSNVDVNDGSKIVGHLLGSKANDTTEAAATRAGLNNAKTGMILALAAPLLMSLLGQQTSSSSNSSSNNAAGIGSLMGSLLGSGSSNSNNTMNLLSSLLGGGSTQTATTTTGKKKKKEQQNNDNSLLDGFISLLK